MNLIEVTGMQQRPFGSGWLSFVCLFIQIVAMVLVAPGAQAADPSLKATISGTLEPGTDVTVLVVPQDTTANITSVRWSQTEGLPVAFVTPDTANPVTVTLSSLDEYLAALIEALKDAPITAADLPSNLVLQEINTIEKGLQNRNQVVGVNPLAHEHAALVVLSVQADLDDGTTLSADVSIETALPWGVSTGVRTLSVDVTVLLYAKDDAAYNWAITEAPIGSSAALTNPTTQTPWFTPDKVGTYRIQEFACDTSDHACADIFVHAGTYHGVIDPTLTLASVQSGDGRPVADPNCTGCHTEGGAAPPNFDTWRWTGHAEAFTQGITTNGHFGESCFACHAVGFGTTSGSDGTDAKVRVMGDTHVLTAGFMADNVGKGATCMTCHNSRRGLRNDQVWDSLTDSEKTGGPHHGVQADLIMGQNAYFFSQNELIRGNHSLIEDTCVTCHMNATQPPAILSYNQQGTNHTFAADPGICVEWHGLAGETLADNVDEIVTDLLTDLNGALSDG